MSVFPKWKFPNVQLCFIKMIKRTHEPKVSFFAGLFPCFVITNFVRQSSYGAVGDIKYIQPSAKLLQDIQVHFCNGPLSWCCCPDCLDSYSQKYRFIYVIDYFLVVPNKVPNILVLQTLSFACLSFPCFGCITKR